MALDVAGETRRGPLYRSFRPTDLAAGPVRVTNNGDAAVQAVVSVIGAPVTPEPAADKGFSIERLYYTLDGERAEIGKVKQNERFAVVLKITEGQPSFGRIIVSDYLPAGFEIDNPRLVSSGDTGTLSWIEDAKEPTHSEFRDDRFTAAFDRASGDKAVFTVAYVVRAVSPGKYVAAAGLCRGHVSSRSLRPYRRRHGGDRGGEVSDTPSRWGRRIRVAAPVAAVGALLTIGGGAAWVQSLGPAPLGESIEFSTVVVDRNGRLLRPYATPDGRWRLPATVKDVDPRYLDLLIAYEDKRFRSHHGVDPLAVARAAFQLVTHGRIVSGGSTITMQVARLLEPRTDRTFLAKLRQAVRAIELERALTKDEILTLYLGLAPYGGNLEGVRAASLAYFGKEPKRLSLGEAAMLVAMPQSPEARRPDRSAEIARARARPRARSRGAGRQNPARRNRAGARPSRRPSMRKAMPMLAPHAADQAIAARRRPQGASHSRIDATHPEAARRACARTRPRARAGYRRSPSWQIDNATGEVLARVAGADYFDERRAGQVDMTQAVRSPGSTLKPFIYGLAFEDGLIHPETLIEDRPIRYGSYAPENFDLTFQGTVSVRKALQMSLNVPAVVAARCDPCEPADRAHSPTPVRISCLPKGEAPGLAMGLGGVGVTLTDLTMLYAGLARGGNTVALTERRDAIEAPAQRPADRSGRRLVHRQRADRHAAAGECRRRPHRVQDRHHLRLSRRMVGRLRRQAHHRRVGRAAGRRAGSRDRRSHGRRADPVRCVRAPGRPAGAARQGAEGRDLRAPTTACRCRCSGSVRTRWSASNEQPRRASCSRRTARGSNGPRQAPTWR